MFRSKAFQENHYIHIFKKHNITEEQFNNNIAYYSTYPEEMEKIYKLADQMDRLRETEPKENLQWTEEDLIDLFGKKTIH